MLVMVTLAPLLFYFFGRLDILYFLALPHFRVWLRFETFLSSDIAAWSDWIDHTLEEASSIIESKLFPAKVCLIRVSKLADDLCHMFSLLFHRLEFKDLLTSSGLRRLLSLSSFLDFADRVPLIFFPLV